MKYKIEFSGMEYIYNVDIKSVLASRLKSLPKIRLLLISADSY